MFNRKRIAEKFQIVDSMVISNNQDQQFKTFKRDPVYSANSLDRRDPRDVILSVTDGKLQLELVIRAIAISPSLIARQAPNVDRRRDVETSF